MTKIDWENITNYIESVGTTDTNFPFNKPQSSVKVTASGATANIIYTIGGQSGTLTPGKSVTVTGSISTMTLRSASGQQPFQVWAVEANTEQDYVDTDFTTQLAQKASQSDVSKLQAKTIFYPKGGFNYVQWNTGNNTTNKQFVDSWDLSVVKRVCFEFLFKWDTTSNPNNTNIHMYNSDAEIIEMIQYIQAKGIEITSIRPRFTRNDYSAYPVTGSSNITTFLTNYQTLMQHCVDTFAVPYGIKNFTVSVEFENYTSTNQSIWQSLISYIQSKSLKATVSYGWGEQNTSVFNSYLDSIGLNIYPFVSDKDFNTTLNYALQNLYSSTYMSQLISFKKTYNKPLWIAETGTTSGQYALANPASTDTGVNTNDLIQWTYFKAVLQYFGQATINNVPLFDYLFIWDLGSSTDGFNPLNNQSATNVIKEYFNTSYYNVNSFSVSGNPVYPNNDTVPKIVNNVLYTENVATDLRNKQKMYNLYRGNPITITDDIYDHYLSGRFLPQTQFTGTTPTSVVNPVITVKSRNLLDYTTYTTSTTFTSTIGTKLDIKAVRPITGGNGNYVTWTMNGLTVGQSYTLSCKYLVLNGIDSFGLSVRNADGTFYQDTKCSQGIGSITFTAAAATHLLRAVVDFGTTNNTAEVLVYDIQFEQGTQTPYIKYMNYTVSLTGTFQQFDYVDFSSKTIVQQTNSFTLTGAAGETWAINHPSGGDHVNTVTFQLSNTTSLNSDFSSNIANLMACYSYLTTLGVGTQTGFSYDEEGIWTYNNMVCININRSRIGITTSTDDATSVTSLKTWLTSNNLVVVYQKPTSTQSALTLPDNIVISNGSNISVSSSSSVTGILQIECPSTLGKSLDTNLTYVTNANSYQWATWTPTLTWTTATPNSITVSNFRYIVIGKMVYFIIRIYATDGNGATGLSITPPITPKTNNLFPYFQNMVLVNNAASTKNVQLRDNGTNNDIKFTYMGTATAAQSLEISISGCYEIN